MTENAFDAREFRNALGTFATGVTVITTQCESVGRVGMTANSFNSVSLDPPMVLWSIAKTSKALDFFNEAGCFCVNVLAADQVSLSNHFASRETDKFTTVDYKDGQLGTPVIDNCAASFECKTAFTYEGGDHIIFVGEVVNFINSNKKALLYHGGRYAVSEPHPVTAPQADDERKTKGFVDDYLDYLLATATHNFEESFQPYLDKSGIGKYEWRVLVTVGDHNGISMDDLSRIVIMEPQALQELINSLTSKGYLRISTDQQPLYHLEDQGNDELMHLLAAAKAHEADTLGNFNLDEARMLKELLKRLV